LATQRNNRRLSQPRFSVLQQDSNSNNSRKQQQHLVACSEVSEHQRRSHSNRQDRYSALSLLNRKHLHLLDSWHNRARQGRTHISKHF